MQIQLLVSYLDSFLIMGGIFIFCQLVVLSKLLFAGISREHVGNRPGKSCSGTFFCLYPENVAVCSVHARTSAPLTLLPQWVKKKFRYFGVETEVEMKCRCFSLKYLEVPMWKLVTI